MLIINEPGDALLDLLLRNREELVEGAKVEISLYNSNSNHKMVEFNILRDGSEANTQLQLWTRVL